MTFRGLGVEVITLRAGGRIGPIAQRQALFQAAKEAYSDPTSPFFGSRPVVFVHDEIIAEVPEGKLHEAAFRLSQIMVEAMSTLIRRVKISATPAAMRRWTKEATDKYENGKLIPYEDAR